MTACAGRRDVDEHFAGTIAPDDERTMRMHLVGCESCRARYRRHLVLAELDPLAMRSEERIGRGLGLMRPPAVTVRRALGRRFAVGLSLVAAVAVIAFVLRPTPRANVPADEGEFVPRGSLSSMPRTPVSAAGAAGASMGVDTGRSSPLVVLRVPDSDSAVLTAAGDALRRDDELAFAYRNDDRKPYLMIFGVDEQKRVYWFHPGWATEAENPKAIPVETDGRVHELREAIRHPFTGESLEVHALFLDAPVSVRDIESAVGARGAEAGPLVVPGGVDHVLTFGLRP